MGTVSARDIARAAAARNESAVQYHFGNLDSLVRAMLIDRANQIDEDRKATLAEIDAAGEGTNLERLIEATIAPALQACQDEDGRFFILFLVQLTADPRFNIEELLAGVAPDSMIILTDRIRTLLHHLPPEARNRRMRMTGVIGINLAAEYARLHNNGTPLDLEEAIADAVASMHAFLMAKPKK